MIIWPFQDTPNVISGILDGKLGMAVKLHLQVLGSLCFWLRLAGKRWPWHILLRGKNTHLDTLADGMLYSVVDEGSWVCVRADSDSGRDSGSAPRGLKAFIWYPVTF